MSQLEARGGGAKGTSVDVLRHPVRIRILEACTIFDQLSPVEMLHRGILQDVESVRSKKGFKDRRTHVAYHCRKLEEAGCLEVVDHRKVRGFVEFFYRAKAQAYFPPEEWMGLEYEERVQISRTMWRGLVARGENAMMQDTFDARKDRVLAWFSLSLDERGWDELFVANAGWYAEVERIKRDAEARLEETGKEAIPATAGVVAFESPPHPITPDDK